MNKQTKKNTRNSITERYIYAVTAQISYKMRNDVARELRSLVSDMLEERYGAVPPDERQIRVVLTELGKPEELAQKYRENANLNCLIGGNYYQQYSFLIKTLLTSVVFALTAAHLVIGLLETGVIYGNEHNTVFWGTIIRQWFLLTIRVSCAVFTFITLLFAVLERAGIQFNMRLPSDNIDNLPPIPFHNIKRDAVLNMLLCVIFCILFLVFPSLFIYRSEGEAVSVFNTPFLRASWLFILLYAAFGIIRETLSFAEGFYTRRLLRLSLVLNAVSAATAFCWLQQNILFSQAFIKIISADAPVAGAIFGSRYWFFALMCFALALDCGKRITRTRQEKENP